MKFKPEWNTVARIDLLERWILVQSYIYYELNENVASDFDYDDNAKQLFGLIQEDPEAFRSSRYYRYFRNYEPGCTSGFELIRNVQKEEPELYDILYRDALMAIRNKYERMN